MWCDASGSGSVVSELMWWLEPGMMHHLDQTSISHLQIQERKDGRKLLKVFKYKCYTGDVENYSQRKKKGHIEKM